MKIASWNVNSVRLRKRAVSRFLRTFEPDVLCLQETKVVDELFPREIFQKLGYEQLAVSGQKSYHGVAIVSRLPLDDVGVRARCRHIHAALPGGVTIHNIYAPAGGDVPDPEVNPKFREKLRFYRSISRWFRKDAAKRAKAVLVGDLNIAPLPNDVWSHQKLKRVVTHTPVEVAALERLASTLGWVDGLRKFVPRSRASYPKRSRPPAASARPRTSRPSGTPSTLSPNRSSAGARQPAKARSSPIAR